MRQREGNTGYRRFLGDVDSDTILEFAHSLGSSRTLALEHAHELVFGNIVHYDDEEDEKGINESKEDNNEHISCVEKFCRSSEHLPQSSEYAPQH